MKGCYFCGNTDTKYCPICDKYLCDVCRKDYAKRTKEALRLGIGAVRRRLLGIGG